jgi:hypothetical protein
VRKNSEKVLPIACAITPDNNRLPDAVITHEKKKDNPICPSILLKIHIMDRETAFPPGHIDNG